MDEVPPSVPDAMEDVVATNAEPAAPTEPEYISETLYIQNLNEKIKIDGRLLSVPHSGC
jgi:U2 small nuclear ribonucleoprotein B''